MATDEIASEAGNLIMELLADGEWHSHRQIVGDLLRSSMSEYAIRGVVRAMRDDPRVEAADRRNSHRHSPSWWYRIKRSA